MAEEFEYDQGEKTEEPSSYRVEEFRKRGEVASSRELTGILILAASIMTLGVSLVYIYEVFSQYIEWIYSLNVDQAFTEKYQKIIVNKTVMAAFKCAGPILLVTAVVALLANVIQIGFLFSPEVLNLKLERINPLAGIKRLFSIRSLVEAVKGIFKFVFILSIVYLFIKDDLTSYRGFLHLSLANSFLYAKWHLMKLSLSIALGLFVVALADFAYQKYTYRKKLMMTKEQAKKELKEKEGNPEIKQRIKMIQREMANKRMMAHVKKADVVVTNPTHYSVAIKYDAETMISPQVVAKGKDHLALKIKEVAKKNNVPLVENIYLARSLYKTVKIGAYVPRTLYKAMAEVLAFVYKLKRKEKALK